MYFPSVPEVTPTNSIVSIVSTNKGPTADAGSDIVVYTLQNIIFNGSNSFDPDGWIMNFTWEFGDGEFGYGMITSHSYTEDGNYYVNLTVKDDWGYLDFHEIKVQVLNRLPEANLEADLTEVLSNSKVTFDASLSSDLDGSIEEYYFDFGDGSNSGWVLTASIEHIYSKGARDYTAKLKVKDDDSGISTNTAEVKITVNNRVPEPHLNVTPILAKTYEDITCNAELSLDHDGEISSYYFDFGDGTNSGWVTSAKVTHQYSDGPNIYQATLKVKDDDGAISPKITSGDITIQNQKPIPSLTIDQTDIYTLMDVKFDASDSYDIDGDVVEYYFDFGDKTNSGWQTEPIVKHEYSDGTREYTIELQVKDSDGETDHITKSITVKNREPKADAGSDVMVNTNEIVNLNGGLSSDLDGSIVTYTWSFGDETSSTGETVTHSYLDDGRYAVTLTVTDDDGAIDTDVCIVTVNNVAPTAGFSVDHETGDVTSIFKFESTSDDTDGTIMTFHWSFGDGETSAEPKPTHQYKSSGKYTVTLIVEDDDGAKSTAFALSISVINLRPLAFASASTTGALVGESIRFIGTQSYDPDGTITNYTWQFDDGGYGYGQIVQHSYYEKGTYNVKLTVVDDAKNSADVTLEIKVIDKLPVIDSDGDGYPDAEDAFPYDPAASWDSDLDGYPDAWNPGKTADDSTTGLTLDEYPHDSSRHKKEEAPEGVSLTLVMIAVIIFLIIIALISFIIRKKKRPVIGEPYSEDEILNDVSSEILTDPAGQNLKISRDVIKSDLDKSLAKGEISEETYKYINEQILYSEDDKQNKARPKNK